MYTKKEAKVLFLHYVLLLANSKRFEKLIFKFYHINMVFIDVIFYCAFVLSGNCDRAPVIVNVHSYTYSFKLLVVSLYLHAILRK